MKFANDEFNYKFDSRKGYQNNTSLAAQRPGSFDLLDGDIQQIMQTLFIPDRIYIDIVNQNGNPFRQENILLGIKTFATHKNDINLFPFLTDSQGHITITKEQIQNKADIFISYGIMDYIGLVYAKPDIKIYYWGNNSIQRCVAHRSMILENGKRNKQQYGNWVNEIAKFTEQLAEIEIRERKEILLFERSFNRTVKQIEDIVLLSDKWSEPTTVKSYKLTLDV